MQCIDCNVELCVGLIYQGVYICKRNHLQCHMCVQKNGHRCEICGDSNLLELKCNQLSQAITEHESSNSVTTTELEITAQKNALSNISDKILSLVKVNPNRVLADQVVTEMSQCLNQLYNLYSQHETTQNVCTQVSCEFLKNSSFCCSTRNASMQTEATKVDTNEQQTQTFEDIWAVMNKDCITQEARDINYKIMTAEGVPQPQTIEMSKSKNFDLCMHALFNAYRESPLDLVQPNHNTFNLPRCREMHIPTAPLEEIVTDEVKSLPIEHNKNLIISNHSQHIKELVNQDEPEEIMEWKHCQTDVEEESVYTSEHVLKKGHFEDSATKIELALSQCDSDDDAVSAETNSEESLRLKYAARIISAAKCLQRKIKKKASLSKNASVKLTSLKRSSIWDWTECHIPKIWRVLYNPTRQITCPLHTTAQACHCDFKAYGNSPMIQPIMKVAAYRNYKQKPVKVFNYEELTLLHAPINCPDAECQRKFLIPDCCYHYISHHAKLPVYNVYPGERIDFELHPCPSRENYNRSRVMFLVKHKIQGVGRNQYNQFLPLILMVARIKGTTLARMRQSDSTEVNKRNGDYLLLWICGMSALELKTAYTLTLWRYKKNVPLCHLSHSSTIVNMRSQQTPLKIYDSGRALLISPNELYILTAAHTDLLQCQVVIN